EWRSQSPNVDSAARWQVMSRCPISKRFLSRNCRKSYGLVLLGFIFERKQIPHISVTRRRSGLEHPSSPRPGHRRVGAPRRGHGHHLVGCAYASKLTLARQRPSHHRKTGDDKESFHNSMTRVLLGAG